MATFRNPNSPQQPQPGVYGWFLMIQGKDRCLYIGSAGKRATAKTKGTLLRGITELQRDTFSSDSPKYQRLDTDFVVGTAIRFFENEGYSVYWKHISDDPQQEKDLHAKWLPLIQKPNTPYILSNLKIPKTKLRYWKWPGASVDKIKACEQKMLEAEGLVFDQLRPLLNDL
jgi:hypothetical protein